MKKVIIGSVVGVLALGGSTYALVDRSTSPERPAAQAPALELPKLVTTTKIFPASSDISPAPTSNYASTPLTQPAVAWPDAPRPEAKPVKKNASAPPNTPKKTTAAKPKKDKPKAKQVVKPESKQSLS